MVEARSAGPPPVTSTEGFSGIGGGGKGTGPLRQSMVPPNTF